MSSAYDRSAPSVSTEDGLRALTKAEQCGLTRPYAICGGLAMHLYGFTRATTDIDVLAEGPLDLPAKRSLSFGGFAYDIDIGSDRSIELDVIIRNDEQKKIYAAALDQRTRTNTGLPILTPEWLVIIKQAAGRGKDHLDLMYLLREPGLVNREKVAAHLRSLIGEFAFWIIKDLESLYLEADLLRARDERGK